jgi:outer membrane lipoprotein carrier protein
VKFSFQTAANLVCGLLLGLWATSAGADARQTLSARLDALAEYAADFSQEIRGAQGQVIERSTGQIFLKRPQFKWVVDYPYPQVIVTEGDVLKVYDPDLEQLTIRPLEDALTSTPVSLLTDNGVVLGDEFQVVEVADELGASYILSPNSPDTLYAEIRLHFAGDSLVGLAILDHLGQFTEILFTPVGNSSESTVIQSSEFQLSVPPGTDVIGG